MALTLRSASALEAYQRSYVASGDPDQVVHFLLLSDRFPRAVLYCLRQAEDQLDVAGRHRDPGDAADGPGPVPARVRRFRRAHARPSRRARAPTRTRSATSPQPSVPSTSVAPRRSTCGASYSCRVPASNSQQRGSGNASRHPLPHRVRVRRAGARVTERAARLSGLRRAPAADRLPGHDVAVGTDPVLHRLLGHPRRSLRDPRATRPARGALRGGGGHLATAADLGDADARCRSTTRRSAICTASISSSPRTPSGATASATRPAAWWS